MSDHVRGAAAPGATVDCGTDPVGSLVQMFRRHGPGPGASPKGQCPAMRPVFLKPHGVAAGTFRIRPDLPDDLKGRAVRRQRVPRLGPVLLRHPAHDLRLDHHLRHRDQAVFGTPTPKIFGLPDETTFDFHPAELRRVLRRYRRRTCANSPRRAWSTANYGPYLEAHPKTADILKEMARPVRLRPRHALLGHPAVRLRARPIRPKYRLSPTVDVPPPAEPPVDPTYLAADLEARLKAGEARFVFEVQFRHRIRRPCRSTAATVRWPVAESPFIPGRRSDPAAARTSPAAARREYGENMAWNIWRVTAEHAPQGSIAEGAPGGLRGLGRAAAQRQRRARWASRSSRDRRSTRRACADDVIVRAAIHPAIGIAPGRRCGERLTSSAPRPRPRRPPIPTTTATPTAR